MLTRLTLLTALATSVLALASAGSAWAVDPFPIEESFTNATFGNANWKKGGSAELTATSEGEGKGWLRLTKAEGNKFGYAYYNEAFSSTNGVLAEFEYADYGGTGADGLTFFLLNGSVGESEFRAGAAGGSLGYASCPTNSKLGLYKAYIGVGFDEYGNFTNLGSICGLDGTEAHPNYVSVRGSEEETYHLLAGASKETTESLKAERSEARHVTVVVTPEDKLSVFIRYPDGTVQTIVENYQLPKEKLPATLKFGFVASTGGSTDDHEIRHTKAAKPTQLTPSVSQTGGGHERGEELTWTSEVKNEGPNETQSERITATTNAPALENVTWTCEASSGAACGTSSGSGLPEVSAGAMAVGSHLTYKITGKAPALDSHNVKVTVKSEPTGDTGEMYPAKEQATATTILAPLFTSNPIFTLSAGGEAKATKGTVIGEEIAESYHWQRCEPNGETCVNITGAEALIYHTTTEDRGHTIRFAQTATNSGGSATADSAAYEPLPKATITEAPSAYVGSRTAKLKFTTTTEYSGATFECKLDAGAWEACASPKEYTGLADGTHTFSVRAVYGGLSEGTPATAEWTVEATPPTKPTITPSHSSPSPFNHESFTFGELVAEGTLECRLDSGAWGVCASPQEYTGLADGEHTIEARQKNKAGVLSEVASYKWVVEATPPTKPTITPSHSSPSPFNHESFTFGELVAEGTLECRLDSGAWGVCASPQEYTGLADGEHTIEARQKNKAGVLSEVASYKWVVEAKRPPAPTIVSAPSSPSAQTNPTFKFGGLEEGDTLECRIDGGEWKLCSASTEFPGLGNGEHTVEARQKNKAGVESDVTTYKWTIDTTPPPAPVPISGPEPETTETGGHFEFTHEPGTTVECSLDGGPYVECTPGLTVSGLPEGWHTILVRQVNAAGLVSPTTSYRWHIGAKPAPKGTASWLTARLGAKATVSDNRSVNVGCKLDGGWLRACTVRAYHYLHGRWVGVGSGRVTLASSGHRAGVVHVLLNARGRRLLVGRLGGLAVTLKVRGETFEGHWLRARRLKARLYPQNVLIIPIVWPFETERSVLVGRARRIVQGAAKEIRHAREVTCIGYTDDMGNWSYNVGLGMRRAQTVCRTLREMGVNASFRAETRGAGRPRATNGTAVGRALNRRVELRVAY